MRSAFGIGRLEPWRGFRQSELDAWSDGMMTKPRRLFLCYGASVALFFVVIGVYLDLSHDRPIPPFIEWISLPGALLAGVHSDYFFTGMTIINIAIYAGIPYLIWTVVERRRNQQ